MHACDAAHGAVWYCLYQTWYCLVPVPTCLSVCPCDTWWIHSHMVNTVTYGGHRVNTVTYRGHHTVEAIAIVAGSPHMLEQAATGHIRCVFIAPSRDQGGRPHGRHVRHVNRTVRNRGQMCPKPEMRLFRCWHSWGATHVQMQPPPVLTRHSMA